MVIQENSRRGTYMRISMQDFFNKDYSIYRDKLNTPVLREENSEITSKNQESKEIAVSPSRQLLDTDEVIDYAQKSDLATDKNLIGSNSSLENLDVEKALSTMEKDKVLQQYNFFVADVNSEDGFVVKRAM